MGSCGSKVGEASVLRKGGAGPFAGAELGPMIGCWGGSLLYRGTWHEQQVAIMVTDHLMESEEAAEELEAGLASVANSTCLHHPNLVDVHSCATVRPQLTADPADEEWRGSCFECGPLGTCADVATHIADVDAELDEALTWHGWEGGPRWTHVQVWTVSELCGQGTLETAIVRGWLRSGSSALGKPTAEPHMRAILATAHEIAAALRHLHSHGYVHGDLNATSVLLCPATSGDRPFTAKLTSACHLACHKALPRSPQTLRLDTAAHTAPEVLLGSALGTPESNVYALGVLCYEMFTGTLLWDTLHGGQLMRDMLAGLPVLPAMDQCPPAFQELVSACISPRPQDRPSLPSILASLEAMLSGTPEAAAASALS